MDCQQVERGKAGEFAQDVIHFSLLPQEHFCYDPLGMAPVISSLEEKESKKGSEEGEGVYLTS